MDSENNLKVILHHDKIKEFSSNLEEGIRKKSLPRFLREIHRIESFLQEIGAELMGDYRKIIYGKIPPLFKENNFDLIDFVSNVYLHYELLENSNDPVYQLKYDYYAKFVNESHQKFYNKLKPLFKDEWNC